MACGCAPCVCAACHPVFFSPSIYHSYSSPSSYSSYHSHEDEDDDEDTATTPKEKRSTPSPTATWLAETHTEDDADDNTKVEAHCENCHGIVPAEKLPKDHPEIKQGFLKEIKAELLKAI